MKPSEAVAGEAKRVDVLSPTLLFVSPVDLGTESPDLLMAAHFLAEQGFTCKVLVLGTISTNQRPVWFNKQVSFEVVGLRSKWRYLVSTWRLLRLRFMDPGLLFYVVDGSCNLPMLLAGLGMSRQRLVYHQQNFYDPQPYPIQSWVESQIIKRAGLVVFNDVARAKFVYSHNKLLKVNPPVIVRTTLPKACLLPRLDVSVRQELLSALKANQKTSLILHIGPIREARGGQPLLQAMSLLPERFKLVYCGHAKGSPQEKEFEEAANQTGLGERILNLGRLEFDELLAVAACCDIGLLLYPDRGVGNYYQCPGRLTQYLRAGLPLVMPDFTNFELLNLRHDLGALCNPADAISIRTAIEKVEQELGNGGPAMRLRLQEVANGPLSYEQDGAKLEASLRQMLSPSAKA